MSILDHLNPPTAPTPVMKMAEMCALLQRSRHTIYRWVDSGELPQPLRTAKGKLIGWDRDEVMVYLNP